MKIGKAQDNTVGIIFSIVYSWYYISYTSFPYCFHASILLKTINPLTHKIG